MTVAAGQGIISAPCNYSVDQAVEKLKGILKAKGVILFALIDHSGEAEKAEMKMPPTNLLIFGSLCLPKTPSVLKLQRLRAFMRSLWDHDELSFRRPFLAGRLQLSNPCRPAGRDPCASSPTHRSPKERAASSATPALRPILVDRALAMVARLALQSAHRSPRYGDRLASQSFRVVLDAEITPASGKTERGRRNSPPDSRHERSEPVVGSAAHSRGTAQVRNRSRTIDRG